MSQPDAVDVDGELTIQTAAEQFPPLLAALEKTTTFPVRLAGVTEMDSAGLQMLLAVRREAERLGGEISFVEPSEAVREALAIVHLNEELR